MRLFFPPVSLPVPDRPDLRLFAEARIAESWAEVDELILWLLEDAVALDLNKESAPANDEDAGNDAGDATDQLQVSAAALDALTLDETPQPPEPPAADEDHDAHQWPDDDDDDGTDDAARASAWAQTCASLGLDPTAPPTPNPISTTPIYLLGLDTETDTARKDAPVLPDGIPRTAPSTLQLATRSRVLIVPTFHLYFHDAPTVSPALRHLLTERNDVVFAGVGIAEDAAPMAHWDLVPRHVVDVATVVRPWNVASGIEDLVFRFTTMLDDDTRDTDDDEADLVPPLPTNPAADEGACPFCPPAHTSSRPPPHLFTESHARHLVCPTTGTYPYLRVGWKSKSLIFSPWDAAPRTWPVAAMQYAALDALASHHVGASLWPHAPPSALPTILPVPITTPRVRVNHRYRPPFRRVPHGGAAPASVHRALLHVAGAPHRAVAVRDAAKKIAAAKLLRVADRNAVVQASLAHLVKTGHVQVRNEPGPRGGRGVARIVHVCPWAPDAPPVRMEEDGMSEVPADLAGVLADGLPRLPGHVPTREEMVRYIADHYPILAVYAARDARRVARAWVAALGEEGVEAVQQYVVEQTGADAVEHAHRMRKAKAKRERKVMEARGETPTSSTTSPSPALDEPSPAAPRKILSAAEFLEQNPDDDLSEDDLPRVPVPQQQQPAATTPSPSRSTPPTPTAPTPSRRSPRRTFPPDVLDSARQFLGEFAFLSARSHADPNLLVDSDFWAQPSLEITMATTIRRAPLVRVLAAVFPHSRSVGAAHALLDALGGGKIVAVAWDGTVNVPVPATHAVDRYVEVLARHIDGVSAESLWAREVVGLAPALRRAVGGDPSPIARAAAVHAALAVLEGRGEVAREVRDDGRVVFRRVGSVPRSAATEME
ncbi:hypothetical protein GGF32_002435 [Allomyces javanicus]|nr:hypothetical protein GGF32_002435 [Allomyces javanicus]